jgi:hypothetical protein
MELRPEKAFVIELFYEELEQHIELSSSLGAVAKSREVLELGQM